MVEDASEFMGTQAPPAEGFPGHAEYHFIYVEDVDATAQRFIKAGGKVQRPIENQFYGDRSSGVKDPFGNHWWIHTHIEDVPPEELSKRAEAFMKQQR